MPDQQQQPQNPQSQSNPREEGLSGIDAGEAGS